MPLGCKPTRQGTLNSCLLVCAFKFQKFPDKQGPEKLKILRSDQSQSCAMISSIVGFSILLVTENVSEKFPPFNNG